MNVFKIHVKDERDRETIERNAELKMESALKTQEIKSNFKLKMQLLKLQHKKR